MRLKVITFIVVVEVMSELTNPHKFWGSYQVNNHSKTLYIRTRLHQIKVSSFLDIYSSKVGTLVFQRETNLVIGGYLAGLPDRLLIVFFLSSLPSESSFHRNPEHSVYWFCVASYSFWLCSRNNFALLSNSTHSCSKYSSYHFIKFCII